MSIASSSTSTYSSTNSLYAADEELRNTLHQFNINQDLIKKIISIDTHSEIYRLNNCIKILSIKNLLFDQSVEFLIARQDKLQIIINLICAIHVFCTLDYYSLNLILGLSDPALDDLGNITDELMEGIALTDASYRALFRIANNIKKKIEIGTVYDAFYALYDLLPENNLFDDYYIAVLERNLDNIESISKALVQLKSILDDENKHSIVFLLESDPDNIEQTVKQILDNNQTKNCVLTMQSMFYP